MKYETNLQSIIQRTVTISSYRYPRPQELNYKPGQYFALTLKQQEQELIHYFSFSSSPTDKDYIEFTKRLSDSQYSNILKNAQIGDWAKIDGPYGNFTFEGEYPNIALLAGGIGVTPFISICKNATDKKIASNIVLFFACRSPEDIPFQNELKELSERNKNLKVIYTVNVPTPNWEGLTGNIDPDMVKKNLPDYLDYIFYACGPPPMVKAMEILAQRLGLPQEKLKIESFTGYP